MRLLIDGVAFQLVSQDARESPASWARPWETLLPDLAALDGIDLIVLDRGGAPHLDGVETVPYPAYVDRYTADDSALLQKVCDHFAVEVFASTGFTTPLRTPSLLLGFDFDSVADPRRRKERDLAFLFARRRLLASAEMTKRCLSRFPALAAEDIALMDPDQEPRALAVAVRTHALVLAERAEAGSYQAFFQRWAYLRRLQAKVDMETFAWT